MYFAHSLAERIQETRFGRFSADAVRWAKNAVCDTVAVGIAGVDSATARIARRVTECETEKGACQILGTRFRSGPLAAARANGNGKSKPPAKAAKPKPRPKPAASTRAAARKKRK